MAQRGHEPTFSHFIDKAFWALLLGSVGFGVHFLSELSATVRSLDEKMLLIVERQAYDHKTIGDHEARLNTLEHAVLEGGHK